MEINKSYSICENPDCHSGLFVPTRADQRFCCVSCKNKVNYQKRQELIINRYNSVNFVIKADRKLEELYSVFGKDAVYADNFLREVNVPIDAALLIVRNQTSGQIIHFFSNYGIMSVDGISYSIIKRNSHGR